MIPDNKSLTLNFTWIIPVIIPANAPASVAATNANSGFFPEESMMVVTAAPNGKVLSTDRSGKSNILYVIYTPSAMIA